jgi:hypothetical protein
MLDVKRHPLEDILLVKKLRFFFPQYSQMHQGFYGFVHILYRDPFQFAVKE